MARTQLNPPAAQGELLPVEIPPAARHPKVRMITRSEIFPDPEQPRQQADAELRDSLARNGMLHPITVRRHPSMVAGWMIVDGERRWRSAEGVMEDLPCIVREDMEELPRRLATQLEANTGKSLTPLEEARAFGKLLEETGASVADLAKLLGRAPSTIAERVSLLELGPWLPAIESGAVVMSHAVKVLLPIRGLADELHAKAVEQFFDEHDTKALIAEPMMLDEFRDEVMSAYKPFLYPLAKSKSYGVQNPEFNTAKHDAECECGGVTLAFYSYDKPRRYCGNPDWWKPRDLAAKKAAKQKAKEERAKSPAPAAKKGGHTLYLPAGAKHVASQYGSTPSGVVELTDSNGTWRVNTWRLEDAFDPADLEIDDAKLVSWGGGYSGAYPSVGTKDTAAVERARAKWKARFDAEFEQLCEQLANSLQEHRHAYRVEGPGVTALAGLLSEDTLEAAVDVAKAIGWAIPERIGRTTTYRDGDALVKWIASLTDTEASVLLSSLAAVEGHELVLPSVAIEARQKAALENIRKRTIPWKAKPKAEKKPAPKKAPAKSKAARIPPAAQFMKPMYPSAALAAVVGSEAQPRTEVTKALWKYIKKHGLQDTKNRRMIHADDALRAIFGGRDQVSLFEMTKLVNKHLAGTAEAAALIYTSGKKKAKGKKAASKLPLSKLSAETAELPLSDDPLATFRDEEAELTLADERAAAGAFDEDEEDEAPGVGAGWDDDSDDLWDDAADELEEATG